MILTADKGVSIVVIDKEEYIRKVEELLTQPTYKPIPTEPTNKYKNKLITLLKKIKTEGGIDESHTEGSTLLGLVHPNSMGYQKCIGLECH